MEFNVLPSAGTILSVCLGRHGEINKGFYLFYFMLFLHDGCPAVCVSTRVSTLEGLLRGIFLHSEHRVVEASRCDRFVGRGGVSKRKVEKRKGGCRWRLNYIGEGGAFLGQGCVRVSSRDCWTGGLRPNGVPCAV